MLRILAIGNSFSQDATRYLSSIAAADGQPIFLYDLVIGGCPLSKHFRNMKSGDAAYNFEFNSQNTELKISLQQALTAADWDFVTLQQVSHFAPKYETYQPYLNELAAFIRSYAPKAKLLIHQTWAYEEGGKRLTQELKYNCQLEMYRDVKAAYQQAQNDIRADGILPSGEMFQRLIQAGLTPVHRDGFHANLGRGRYALATLWYELLFRRTVIGNSFDRLDEPISPEERLKIQQIAHSLAEEYRF